MKKNAGSTMLLVLAVLGTLSACVIAALNYTAVVNRNVMRSNAHRSATEIGDGALEYAFTHWREICRLKTNVQRPTSDFAGIPLPSQALFPLVSNFTSNSGPNPATGTPYTIANFKVKAVDPQLNDLADDTTTPIPGIGMTRGTASYFYLATADVSVPSFAGKPVSVKLRRVFEKQLESPWNYAIFYTDRLEIHPSPPFTVTGWVHTNERLYTAHNTLTFASKVTYGDDWANKQYAPGDRSHDGDVKQSANYPNNLPPARDQQKQPFGLDSTRIFNSSDANPNNDSYRELIERPDNSSSAFTDPIADARYYNQADIRILVDASNNVVLRNASDQVINSASTGNNKLLYDTFTAAIKTNDKLQDNREKSEMRIVTLDMSVIYNALTPTSQGGTGKLIGTGFQGIIYASDTSGSSTVKRGVRLKNGSKMPDGGLTVASDNPVYIQGDYNTGRTSSSETPANSKNDGTGANVVSGYTRQPCAVVADAVNILSNAWTDTNSYKDVSQRKASPTTVNTAIVSGIVPTGTAPSTATAANSYSGGAENFPRFNESWTGSNTFTYYGSMVELFTSKQSVGYWGSSNVYDAPKRQWYFDTLFYTDPPPGTLTLVSYNKQRWFVQ